MTALLFVLGLVVLIGGAELLIRGSSRIARAAGITPLVVGLTVVAFGTSAPELGVTTAAALRGDPDLALGNVLGSNVLNVLLILGTSALVAPLVVERRLVRLEVPFMIAVSAVVVLLSLNRVISRTEGVLLLGGGITYTAVLVSRARAVPVKGTDGEPRGPRPRFRPAVDLTFVALGLALLVLGSRWIVSGAEAMASALGVPQLVVGLTVVAAGTSLPELATSVLAAARGERDMAVGNIIGSNIFNLLIVLGSAAAVSPSGIAVPLAALTFDLPVMLTVAVVCLPILITGLRIDRLEGLIFLGFYIVYTTYLVLDAANHSALDALQDGIMFVALPLTVLTLGAAAVRRRDQPQDASD